MAGGLVMHEQPQLTAPYLMVGLSGWLNAGEVSTGCINYLRQKLGAGRFAQIETQGFYIYQIPSSSPARTMRPPTRIRDGLVLNLTMPQNDFFSWKSGAGHDLILFLGVEPNLEWPAYCRTILDVARTFGAPRIYSLGGIFDQVPHTRETRIHVTVSHPHLKDEFRTFARFGNYEGPASFPTMLIAMGREQGIEVVGISARTSMYIHDLNAKACHDLLKRVLAHAGLQIDLSDLRLAGEQLVETVDNAFRENPEAMAQLKKLEESFDAAGADKPLPDTGEDYDRLLEEVRKLKREGRKPH